MWVPGVSLTDPDDSWQGPLHLRSKALFMCYFPFFFSSPLLEDKVSSYLNQRNGGAFSFAIKLRPNWKNTCAMSGLVYLCWFNTWRSSMAEHTWHSFTFCEQFSSEASWEFPGFFCWLAVGGKVIFFSPLEQRRLRWFGPNVTTMMGRWGNNPNNIINKWWIEYNWYFVLYLFIKCWTMKTWENR